MQCRACAYENETASRFCVACGVSLAPVCAHCGRDFPEGARFCGYCGEARKPEARIAMLIDALSVKRGAMSS